MLKGVTYILKTDANFQALVGQNAALSKYKIYPVICPQPEIVPYSVSKITGRRLTHKGTAGSNRNVFDVDFIVASYHKNYDDVDALDNAVIQALVPFKGTANGVLFKSIEFQDSFDDYENTYGGLYVRMSSFACCVSLDPLT